MHTLPLLALALISFTVDDQAAASPSTTPPRSSSPSTTEPSDAAPPSLQAAPAERFHVDEALVLVWAGSHGAIVPQLAGRGVGAFPSVGLSIRPLSFIEPEVQFAYGAFVDGYQSLRVSIGTKLTLHIDRVRPFLSLAYAHVHETPFSGIVDDPVGTLLTTSKHVSHRSGAEVGIGALAPMPVPFVQNAEVDLMLRLVGVALPRLEWFDAHADETPFAHDGYVVVELAVGIPVWG